MTNIYFNVYINYNTTENIKAIKFRTIKTALKLINEIINP